MAIKKELIQFTIVNDTDCGFNLPLFQQNVYSLNAKTKYSWNITTANLSCGTGTIVVNGVTTTITFAPNLAGLLAALNALGYGFFCTETSGGSTFLYVVDDTNVYGGLDLCPSGTTTTTTTTSTTTAAPVGTTTTTTTTSTTTAAPVSCSTFTIFSASGGTWSGTLCEGGAVSGGILSGESIVTPCIQTDSLVLNSATVVTSSPCTSPTTTTTTTSTTTAAPETTTTTTTTSTTTAAPLSVTGALYSIQQINITECQVQVEVSLSGNVSQNTSFDFQYQLTSTGATLYFGTITVLAGQNTATALFGSASEALCSDTVFGGCINTVTGDSVSIVGFSC